MADNPKKDLNSEDMNEQTGKDIQSKGGRASQKEEQTQNEGFKQDQYDESSNSEEFGLADQGEEAGENAGQEKSSRVRNE